MSCLDLSDKKLDKAIIINHSRYNRQGPVVGRMFYYNNHYIFGVDVERGKVRPELTHKRLLSEWKDWGKEIKWFRDFSSIPKDSLFWVTSSDDVEIIGWQRPRTVNEIFLESLGV